MYWIMLFIFFAYAQEDKIKKEIYIAPPTIHDQTLVHFQPYLNSLLVSSAQSNKHWVKRTHDATEVNIYDKHTIELIQDTVCDYDIPIPCSVENIHWVMITDIFVTPNFATIVVKMYDEDARLIASSSKSSYSIEKCTDQTTVTTIQQFNRPATEITEKKPDLCTALDPKILASDIVQAVTILFASIHPVK